MCWCEFIIDAFHRKLKSVVAVYIVVTESAIVTHPVLVNILVEARFESVNPIGFIFYGDITTDTASCADAVRLFHKPGTRLEQEILAD